MKKKLFTLLVCVLASIGANAYDNDGTTLTVYPEDLQSGSAFINGGTSVLGTAKTIKLSGKFTSWESCWLGDNGAANDKMSVTEIDLSGADLSAFTTTSWKFSNFENLKTIKWPPVGKISVIPSYAFKKTGIETVRIPGYITRIMSQAFDSDSGDGYLKNIIFDEYDAEKDNPNDPNYGNTSAPGYGKSDVNMTIETEAFSNTYGVFDVYIETEGDLHAANLAFPEAITYGQGNIKNTLARLHFPDTKAEDYVNQKHTLDQETANDDKLFQAWLVAHYTNANTEGNGWYEFVSNGSSKKPDADMGDAVLYTFSHPTIDYIVPKGAKAFIVGSVKPMGDGDYFCELVKVNVIPHGTGVIIFGGTNSKSSEGYRNLEMTAVVYEGRPYDRTPQEVNDVNVVNLLLPSTNAAGETFEIKPYDLTADGKKIEYRNFVFSKFSSSDSGKQYYAKHGDYGTGEGLEKGNYYGFFRTKKGTTKPGKAFLRCLATEDEVFESTCGEIQVLEHPTYRVEYDDEEPYGKLNEDDMVAKPYWYAKKNDASSIILWKHKWGTRALAAGTSGAKYFGEPTFDIEEDETTGVAKVVNSVSANETYFNLNGQQVVNPTKGVYIKNGKKVIVK